MTWHNVMNARTGRRTSTAMKVVKGKMVMIGRKHGEYFATQALCWCHMRWPLAWGAKITDDGCVRCPLHQTTHKIEDGSLVEWSPFPLVPAYGKLVGSMVKPKDLWRLRDENRGTDAFWVDLALIADVPSPDGHLSTRTFPFFGSVPRGRARCVARHAAVHARAPHALPL